MCENKKNNTSPFGCTRLSFMNTKIAKIGIKDEGYACLLECKTDQLASSHQVKRFLH